jgi:hypothetical protein
MERWIGLDAKILRPYNNTLRPYKNTFRNIRNFNE